MAFLLLVVLTIFSGRPNVAFPVEEHDNGEQVRTGGGGEGGVGGEVSREVHDIRNNDLEDWLADLYLKDILGENELLRHDHQNSHLHSSAGL